MLPSDHGSDPLYRDKSKLLRESPILDLTINRNNLQKESIERKIKQNK